MREDMSTKWKIREDSQEYIHFVSFRFLSHKETGYIDTLYSLRISVHARRNYVCILRISVHALHGYVYTIVDANLFRLLTSIH
jgi:hypothetical protein